MPFSRYKKNKMLSIFDIYIVSYLTKLMLIKVNKNTSSID